ncbi:DUF4253 domain-containing protein [Solirubrobacter soli]|uniref:DUF4253 domain-containing protein n=1 Tax=Solirubrobacter soli TaxID=363832 RepID=UPI0003FD30B4|nr:DUF4253 domain-containing protein [Solirubrobacter soli]
MSDELPPGEWYRDQAYWLSDGVVDDVAGACVTHARAFSETGLWPLAWGTSDLYDEEEVSGGGGVDAVDALDAADVIAAHWDTTSSYGDRLSLDGPGLAPASVWSTALAPEKRFAPLRSYTGHRLMLLPCSHPADAIAVLDPFCESEVTTAEISAVLRSWERRFDAVLIAIEDTVLTFSVGAPPATHEQALLLGAEIQVVLPTYDWMRPDGPRNVVHQLLHGTTADPNFPREAELSPHLWRLAMYDD